MIIPIKPWLELADGRPLTGGGIRPKDFRSSALVLSSDPVGEEMDVARNSGGMGTVFSTEGHRMEFYHEPIMGAEIRQAFEPVEGKQFLDGTLGGGGHSEMLLRHGAHVIGLDQDGDAIDYASERLEAYSDRFLPVRGNFAEMKSLLHEVGVDTVDGVLLDLGVSSRQLDDGERGFSFREEAELDMRMDQRQPLTAKAIVNDWSLEELTRIFREYGEEKKAYRVAQEIVKQRELNVIETTTELASIVAKVVPKVSAKNPATRVFQGLRIAVNRELEVLERGLESVIELLVPGGVLAVLSFHSLEDRIVKQFMRKHSQEFLDRPEWPEPRPNPDYCLELPSRRAIAPTSEEVARNARSRSAKLRCAVRLS
ncbi:MAG: 16S rRNA (cytosine(1402)-N(4))-methyltransferase RsmH [Verrucomicrobiales bacterium]|nr:16S rRNA (cytosine(1402)-N(4))-methyltransferase RsmH [Verrucomicrobiales bacterium]